MDQIGKCKSAAATGKVQVAIPSEKEMKLHL